jgi:hypothetical protein
VTTGHRLFDDAARARATVPPAGTTAPFTGTVTVYAQTALDNEIRNILGAANGTRNHTLNTASYLLGTLIGAGQLDQDDTETALRQAATKAGLEPMEISRTIRSGVDAGMEHPRQIDQAPVPPITILGDTPADADPATITDTVREKLPILNWYDLWADTSTEEWIIEPLIPARRLIALFSPPKIGKSLLMLELAVHIAQGGRALGYTLDRPRRVLYIDFENDPRGDIRERLQAMHQKPDQLDNLCYLSYPSLAFLDTEKGALELLAAVNTYQCEVVIIDTISRAVGGEENENDTWLNFYRHTGLRAKQAGLTILRLDHTGKDETKGMRGGSAKYGDVDVVWKMSRLTEDTFRLECTDHRLPVIEKTLIIRRQDGPLRHVVEPRGMSATWEIKVEACIKAMDDAGLPKDAGRDAAADVVRDAGITVRNEVLAEAVRRRKLRLMPLSSVPDDHGLNDQEKLPGTARGQDTP